MAATRAMYLVTGKGRKFDLPVDMQMELFSGTVLPVLAYGSKIRGYYIIKELELFHFKLLKLFLFVHKNTSSDMVGWERIH